MTRTRLFAPVLLCLTALALILGSIAAAEQAKDAKAPGQPEPKLPPGWTEDDMKACMAAATPGKQHEYLAKQAGTWHGKTSMWMPGASEPMKSECTSTVTSIMDGRYIKAEIKGDMPGMGPFSGLGLYGFDNVSQKFNSTWLDNQGTGMMSGAGELSADGRTLTWNYSYNCPITRKPVIMREVETATGENTKTLEMFGPDPKTGKEYKMMSIEFTRK
jgi:hypothetical protein